VLQNNKPFIFFLKKSFVSITKSLPLFLSIIFLISLFKVFLNSDDLVYFFSYSKSLNLFVSAVSGSLFTGNPINSYLISQELLKENISLVYITIFITSWVTVGIVQFPLESKFLGKRFSLIRNITAFFLSILTGFLTVVFL
jgi:uncharacterized membrane protein YraQ (UPF0718 family)